MGAQKPFFYGKQKIKKVHTSLSAIVLLRKKGYQEGEGWYFFTPLIPLWILVSLYPKGIMKEKKPLVKQHFFING